VADVTHAVADRIEAGRPGGTEQRPAGALGGPSRSGSSGTSDAGVDREQRTRGQALINLFLIVTLAAMLVANLPDSVIKARLIAPAQSYLTALGMGQNWGVFAPNPRRDIVFVTADIEYADGTASTWSFPVRDGVMAYSDYRWQKFGEHLRLDSRRQLWKSFATYLARQERADGRRPVRVSLVRHWTRLPPPGGPMELDRWNAFVFYSLSVDGAR
jgi:hypothetical protein